MKAFLIPLLLTIAYPALAVAQYDTFAPQPAAVSTSTPQISGDTFAPEPELTSRPLATDDAAHTPMSEVVRVINMLPRPEVAFVDFGCGYDARWCVAAAEKWKCKCIGVELDPSRARAARERIRNLGLDGYVTIVEGDVANTPVSGDVAVAYLYPTVLAKLKPRLQSFKAFASYLHQPSGIACTKSGDTWIYQRQFQSTAAPAQGAVWDGVFYNQPVCTSPNCAMCNSIRRQLRQ